MDKTQFAGLTRLNPGESLGVDGYSFQHINPQIIDRLLELGAVGHRHDAHLALPDPTDLPVVSELLGGGQMLADTTVWACYTLLDADGGETLPSTAQSVTTPAPLDTPDASPTVTLDTTGGGLLVNTYMYAVTLLDGNGGETTIGPAANVQRPPGPANARAQISGLSSIAMAAGATGWRLWRSVGGARWGYLATGVAATDTFTDDGGTSLDCTQTPPARNTTNAVNQVRVVVPNTQPPGTVSFRIYLSDTGDFTSPSLAGTYPIAEAGANKDYATLSLADGQPPAVSQSLPGAAQINVNTDVYGWTWKTSAADFASLPAVGNVNGDIRMTRDSRIAYIWDTSDGAWHVALTGYLKSPVANAAALPALGNTHGDMRVTLDDNTLHLWGSDDAWHAVGGGGGGGGGAPEAWTTVASLATYAAHFRSISDSTYDVHWHDDGRVVAVASFYKDADVVHMKGGAEVFGMTNDTDALNVPQLIFTLPVGYRPDEQRRFSVDLLQHRGSGGPFDFINRWWRWFIEIRTDGGVWLRFNAAPNWDNTGTAAPDFVKNNDQISFEDIAFRAA